MCGAGALDFDPSVVRKLPTAREGVYGLARWREQHLSNQPDPVALQKLVDAELSAFDDEKARDEARRLALDGKEDEDGWTMVARGGKRVAAVEEKPAKRAKKNRELKNFYRFQQKEARKEQVCGHPQNVLSAVGRVAENTPKTLQTARAWAWNPIAYGIAPDATTARRLRRSEKSSTSTSCGSRR